MQSTMNEAETKGGSVTEELPTPVKLQEGDIYRWSYLDPKTKQGSWGDYHCCSRIAIVNRGRLRDTFWQIGGSFSDGRSFGLEDLPKLELARVANISDLLPAKEYEADYYDDSEIVNLNHSNSPRGNFYLRRGARRSREKMLEVARNNLETSMADERSAASLSEELRGVIRKLEADQLALYIPSPRR
jgi:hypothetical protein